MILIGAIVTTERSFWHEWSDISVEPKEEILQDLQVDLSVTRHQTKLTLSIWGLTPSYLCLLGTWLISAVLSVVKLSQQMPIYVPMH